LTTARFTCSLQCFLRIILRPKQSDPPTPHQQFWFWLISDTEVHRVKARRINCTVLILRTTKNSEQHNNHMQPSWRPAPKNMEYQPRQPADVGRYMT
jgi:hypothetical protein